MVWPEEEESPLATAFSGAERDVDVPEGGMIAVPAPDAWGEWLIALFPRYVRAGFVHRHEQFWSWAWGIEPDDRPRPFVAVWPRGGGKSTSAELATTALGVRGKRRYCLYVRETQEQADKSVSNIATLLESASVEKHYPAHARKLVGKYGNSRGWRREQLRTNGGFTVDALGLDTASRGVKVDDQRPDLIILDDIDNKHDSPAVTAKKIATITTSILPAGATNVAVLAIQNLIIPDGVFTRMVDSRADYLATRIVSGPYPAVDGLEVEMVEDVETGTRRAMIVKGEATWQGQDLTVCQGQMDDWGYSSFLKEAQHDVQGKREGLVLGFQPHHVEDLTDEEGRELVAMGQAFGSIDFGRWRFAFNLRAVDRGGRLRQIAEYFSQRDDLEHRARVIHCILSHYGCPRNIPQWGDAANQTDIAEINSAFERIKSPYRVSAVAQGNKIKSTGVERMNDLLSRNALLYRRDSVQAAQRAVSLLWSALPWSGEPWNGVAPAEPDVTRWRLGLGAATPGVETQGSRLQWEVQHWSYPIAKEGEAQKQEPDDNTADGADACDADRYGIMSWWSAARPEAPAPPPQDEHYDRKFHEVMARLGGTKRNPGSWRKR